MVTWFFPFATTHCWLEMMVELERSFAATGAIRMQKQKINKIAKSNLMARRLKWRY
jgi:hypothetical protein